MLPRPSQPPGEAPPTPRPRRLLKRPQQVALALIALTIVALTGARLATDRQHFPDPLPPFPAGFDRLADRIDPNHAPAGELAVLPGIGPAKADAIIRYREQARADGRWPAFENPQDLQNVAGIGPVITRRVVPYLIFEGR